MLDAIKEQYKGQVYKRSTRQELATWPAFDFAFTKTGIALNLTQQNLQRRVYNDLTRRRIVCYKTQLTTQLTPFH